MASKPNAEELCLLDVPFKYLLFRVNGWAQNHLVCCRSATVDTNEHFKLPEYEFLPADLHLEGSGEFYLCYVSDCYSPPLMVIQCEGGIEEALNLFVEYSELPRISEADLKDYTEIQYADNGIPYDNESTVIRECTLFRADFL